MITWGGQQTTNRQARWITLAFLLVVLFANKAFSQDSHQAKVMRADRQYACIDMNVCHWPSAAQLDSLELTRVVILDGDKILFAQMGGSDLRLAITAVGEVTVLGSELDKKGHVKRITLRTVLGEKLRVNVMEVK